MITITEDDLKKFAPRARADYVAALMGNIYLLRTTGILENSYRICHFLAQVGHETDGLTILRESLTYKTAKRLREVWPARFRDKSDADLKPLLKDPRRLGDAVYLGRMGNTQSGDGYDYRGGGYLQTTGRAAVAKYCERLGLDPSPSLLDDPSVTLQFASLSGPIAAATSTPTRTTSRRYRRRSTRAQRRATSSPLAWTADRSGSPRRGAFGAIVESPTRRRKHP